MAVKVITRDLEEHEIELTDVRLSNYIQRKLPKDADEVLVLDQIDSEGLLKVVDYCTCHKDDPPPVEDDEDLPARPKTIEDIDPWDYDYAYLEKDALLKLTKDAHYLEVDPLITLCCKMLANMVRGRTVEQVREDFGIVNDYSPSEVASTKKEMDWIKRNWRGY